MDKRQKSFENLGFFSKILDCQEETVDRNKNVEGISGEVSDGNKEQVTRNQRKNDPCPKVAKNQNLCSSVSWKLEFISDEPGYSAEEISKQC